MMILLDGKRVASEIRTALKDEIIRLKQKNIVPCLGVILVGEFPPSVIYVRNKESACQEVGINTKTLRLDEKVSESELLSIIAEWNQNQSINGILVQLPLPNHIDTQKVLDAIKPEKDVDGLCSYNLASLIANREPYFYPCTPLGIITLLRKYNIPIEGRHCVIIGRGELVGKPLANMLLQKSCNATVTVCHTKTSDIINFTRQAEILVVAIGRPQFVKREMVKEGAVVIDVGVNRIQIQSVEGKKPNANSKIVGDVAFDEVKEIVSAITPVPGGVGPMTVAMLLVNTVSASKRQMQTG
ncbi:MAG: bifunctional methylenetetrahydrofolate dehydrogenase/methenyltetrahydrofolate cyclohydrolase FolD [candidate division WOR-3 bacterium]|nr:bifunctional methylenetetrahydrofolate dehydrogenase/methenyltetrahydrofolate cyclohydrolase FolD [candidate division WOR-3 bacterium]